MSTYKSNLQFQRKLIICTIVTVFFISFCLFAFWLCSFIKLSIPSKLNTTDNSSSSSTLKIKSVKLDYKLAVQNNFSIDYDIPPSKQAKGTVRIPVLTYHHTVTLPKDPKTRDYYVSPTILEEQMAYLSSKGYTSVTPQEFLNQLINGMNPEQKLVMITFDDGGADNYTYAFPILKKYGMTGVFYVPSNKHGITNKQLKEMSDAGMIIEPHGKTHMLLSKVTDITVLSDEIGNSKINIENLTGKKVVSFCYPGCEYNSTVFTSLRNNGYRLAFSCGKSIDHKISNKYSLSRMHVYNDMNHFKSILSGISYYPSYSD